MSKKINPHTYKEIIEIPEKYKHNLPTSYDVIGDIAQIKISEKLLPYKNNIADAFLKTYKHIKTVCLISPVSGELRKRNVEIIGGEKRLETVHKEYGAKFKLNIEKVYFSPRLATERKRIADLVKKNEVIVDMFTGIAPFPVIIAKYADPKIIYGIEKNKDAFFYAKENILLNNVLNKIEVINEDAKNVFRILNTSSIRADRIIMNLPFMAHKFFKYALKICKNKSIIHYYDFLDESEIEKRIKNLKLIAKKCDFDLIKLDINRIKSYSPREFYIGIDITAKRNNMPM